MPTSARLHKAPAPALALLAVVVLLRLGVEAAAAATLRPWLLLPGSPEVAVLPHVGRLADVVEEGGDDVELHVALVVDEGAAGHRVLRVIQEAERGVVHDDGLLEAAT